MPRSGTAGPRHQINAQRDDPSEFASVWLPLGRMETVNCYYRSLAMHERVADRTFPEHLSSFPSIDQGCMP
jgi:hypothetical protein